VLISDTRGLTIITDCGHIKLQRTEKYVDKMQGYAKRIIFRKIYFLQTCSKDVKRFRLKILLDRLVESSNSQYEDKKMKIIERYCN